MIFNLLQPFLLKNLKIHDICGVHNLHGMPGKLKLFKVSPHLIFSSAGLFGGLLSVLMAGIASPDSYDKFSDGMDKEDKRWVRTITTFTDIFVMLA